MNIGAIITAVIVIAVLGLVLGLFLGFSAKAFHVETDPRQEQIVEALPGNNCGGCGYPGCSGLASAIVANAMPTEAKRMKVRRCGWHIAER